MKRCLMLFCTLVLLAVSLGGFAGAAQSDEVVTIQWLAENHDDSSQAAIQTYWLDPFHAANPGIRVNFEPTPDIENVLKVRIAGGNAPDLMDLLSPNAAAEFGDRLLDLTPYVEQYGWRDIMFDWALESCVIDGRCLSIPSNYESMPLWYNKALMDEHGWNVPTNLEEFKAVCDAALAEGLTPYLYGISGFINGNLFGLTNVYNQFCGAEALKAVLEGNAKWTDELYRIPIEEYKEMFQKGYFGAPATLTDADASALFYNRQGVFLMAGTWALGDLHQNMTDEYGIKALPGFGNGVDAILPMGVGGNWAVSSDVSSEVADACAAFINFLFTDKENQAKGVEAGLQPLPMQLDASLFSDEMDPIALEYFKMVTEAENVPGATGYVNWTFWPLNTMLYQYLNVEKVLFDQMSVDEFLNETQVIFEDDLANGAVPNIP